MLSWPHPLPSLVPHKYVALGLMPRMVDATPLPLHHLEYTSLDPCFSLTSLSVSISKQLGKASPDVCNPSDILAVYTFTMMSDISPSLLAHKSIAINSNPQSSLALVHMYIL